MASSNGTEWSQQSRPKVYSRGSKAESDVKNDRSVKEIHSLNNIWFPYHFPGAMLGLKKPKTNKGHFMLLIGYVPFPLCML